MYVRYDSGCGVFHMVEYNMDTLVGWFNHVIFVNAIFYSMTMKEKLVFS